MFKLAIFAAILAITLAAPASEETPAKTDVKPKRHAVYGYGIAPVNYGSSYVGAPLTYDFPLNYETALPYSTPLTYNVPLTYNAPLTYNTPLTYNSPIKVVSPALTYNSPLSYNAHAYTVSGYHGVSSPYHTIQ